MCGPPLLQVANARSGSFSQRDAGLSRHKWPGLAAELSKRERRTRRWSRCVSEGAPGAGDRASCVLGHCCGPPSAGWAGEGMLSVKVC